MRELEVETVIVGGGVAGLTLACSLAEARRECLVLEAGNSSPVGDWRDLKWYDPQRDFLSVESESVYRTDFLRVKALGGSAEAWEGYVPRWNVADFRQHSLFGVGVDWPFGYEDIEPYYREAERLVGAAGNAGNPKDGPRSAPYPLPAFEWSEYEKNVEDRTRDLGVKWHAYPQARNSIPYGRRSHCNGIGSCNYCPIQARWTPRSGLLPAIRSSSYAKVLTDAVCGDLLIGEDGTLRGLQGVMRDGAPFRVLAHRIVLAAGAIDSARILLATRSCMGRRDGFWRNELIGAGYMDHPIFRVQAEVGWRVGASRQTNILATSHTYRDYDRQTGAWGFALNLNRRALPQLLLAAHFEMPAIRENRICLDFDRLDFAGRPFPKLHITTNYDGFSATESRIRKTLNEVAMAAGGRNLVQHPLQLWACHPMGGCAISCSPRHGVVDADLNVWGSKNLYVLSNAVFATSAVVNPTLTLISFALRLADHLKKGNI